MKTILVSLMLLSSLSAQALPKTVLQCFSVDQSDIRAVIVTDSEDNKSKGLMEMTLFNPQGEARELLITDEDYNEGWIPLPNDDLMERYLIRQENGWEVFGMLGEKNLFFKADCEEAPLEY